jgi:hypothetical protein
VAAVFFKFVRQVNYVDGFKGTFFYAYAASAAKGFCNYSFVSFDTYSFNSASDHWAKAYAELVAFLNFAFSLVKYGNSRHN